MAKTKIIYKNTVIYKIVCLDVSIKDVYVGSTTDFVRRKASHKNACTDIDNKSYDFYVYKFIRENGGWNSFTMLEVEKYPCIDGNASRSRERFHIEALNATLNKVIPTRTVTEYHQENILKINEYQKCTLIVINTVKKNMIINLESRIKKK